MNRLTGAYDLMCSLNAHGDPTSVQKGFYLCGDGCHGNRCWHHCPVTMVTPGAADGLFLSHSNFTFFLNTVFSRSSVGGWRSEDNEGRNVRKINSYSCSFLIVSLRVNACGRVASELKQKPRFNRMWKKVELLIKLPLTEKTSNLLHFVMLINPN